MANIKGKQLTDSLSVTNVTGSNVSASGLITGDSGSFSRLDVSGEVNVAQHIRHLDDPNTFVNFTDDRIQFEAGSIVFLGLHKKGSTPHQVTINNGGNHIDFVVKDNDGDILFRTDADADNVLFPEAIKISGSAASTGSFGRLELDGDISSSASGSFGNVEISNNATIDGDLIVTEAIKHKGDVNTLIRFTDNKIKLEAGGMSFVSLHDDDSAPFPATINPNSERINFRVLDKSGQLLLKTDSDVGNAILFYSGSEKLSTHNTGVNVTGSLTASGDISSSATASFGELEIGNGGDIVLTEDQRIYFEADKNTYIETHAADSFRVVVNERQMLLLDEDTGNRAVFGNGTKVFIGENNNFTPLASLHIAGNLWVSGSDAQGGAHVTASGNISSSATITSENSIVKNDLTVGGNLDIADTIFHTGDSNTKIRFPDVDTIAFNTSGVERLRITSTGAISGSQASTGSFGKVVVGEMGNQDVTSVSSSISTRLTTAESELGNTLLSGSAQIATDISGSLSAAAIVGLGAGVISGSSSNSSLTTAIVDEGAGILSGSAQIASNISGSLSAAAIVGLGAGIVSGSIDGTISSSAQIADDISGSFTSGFEFTGKISGSSTSTGSFGLIESDGDLNVSGRLAHAGDPDTRILFTDDDVNITVGGVNMVDFTQDTVSEVTFNEAGADVDFRIESAGDSKAVFIDASKNTIQLGTAATTHITASGNISGSAGDILGFASASFSNVDAPHIKATNVHGTILTATQGTIDHDSLANFVANEHINHTSVSITAGDGLTGGGTIASTRTLAVGEGTGVTVNANDVAIGQDVATNANVNFASVTTTGNITAQGDVIAENYIVSSSVTYMTSSAISGSSIFGDTQDDTHQFTGSVFVSGSTFNIDENGSVSSSASGSFLNVKVADNLGVTGVFTLPNIANVSASIASAVAGGDDMGNHTATQDLDMDGNDIFDVQHISASGNISGSAGNILGFESGSFQQLDAGVISASSVQATNLVGLVGTATQGTIDHDSLANFVANEHVDHSSITLTAGDGLSGGGTIASNRSFAVDATVLRTTGDSVISSSAQLAGDISGSFSTAAVVGLGAGIISGSSSNSSLTTAIVGEGAGILSGSAQIAASISGSLSAAAIVGLGAGVISASAMVDHDSTTNFVANEHINHTSVDITAGAGLTGGGDISSTRTLAVGQGTGVTVNANDVAIGQAVETDSNVQFANITATATASLAKISGSLIESTGDFTLNSSGDIILDADGTDVILKDGGTSFGSFKRASSDFIIKAETADKDILFKGTDDSTTITALTLDMSEGGNAQFLGNISGSQIEASGDIIAFGSSDRNLKDNIQPIENSLEKIDKIGGYTFVWNDNQSTYKGKDIGVVAQEIQEILPEIVATRANGYLGVKYEKIVPLLIESIKELKKEVEDIKQKCDCLNK